MKGVKRRASKMDDPYRVPRKHREIESDSDDTLSIDSEDSTAKSGRTRVRRALARKESSEYKPSLSNRESTMGGVVTAFLGLRSRTIVRETTIKEEEDTPPPQPRKILSAKRKMVKKSSSAGEIYKSAAVSGLRRKFSESRAATVIF